MLKVNEKEKMLHKCIHNCWGTSGEYLGNPNILGSIILVGVDKK